jgi:hypothetical protein
VEVSLKKVIPKKKRTSAGGVTTTTVTKTASGLAAFGATAVLWRCDGDIPFGRLVMPGTGDWGRFALVFCAVVL